jgi:hypothetical protein
MRRWHLLLFATILSFAIKPLSSKAANTPQPSPDCAIAFIDSDASKSQLTVALTMDPSVAQYATYDDVVIQNINTTGNSDPLLLSRSNTFPVTSSVADTVAEVDYTFYTDSVSSLSNYEVIAYSPKGSKVFCQGSSIPSQSLVRLADGSPLTATPTIPVAPKDPCSKYTSGSAAYNRCTAQITCNNRVDAVNQTSGKSAGYVFLPAFNNACNNLTEFFTTALNYLMLFATLIAGFMFARGMFGILVSRGNPAAVADAREMLTNAAIGLVLLATAFLVIKFLNGGFQAIPGGGINLCPITSSNCQSSGQ